MSSSQASVARVALICAAWAAAQTAQVFVRELRLLDVLLPAGLAAGVYAITQDLGRLRARGGEIRYWRGRPIDDEDDRTRWH